MKIKNPIIPGFSPDASACQDLEDRSVFADFDFFSYQEM
jgi:hypothetical protein